MEKYTPKYILIRNYIIENIQSGQLLKGDKIPSENKLSDMFNVSRVTANTAIRELSTLGLLERIQGKGTFVKTDSIDLDERGHNISKSAKISSETGETRHHKLEKIDVVHPCEELIQKLNLGADEKVYEIIRFMKKKKEVTGIDYSYIPYKYFEDRDMDFNQLAQTYLHEFLNESGVIQVHKIHMHLGAKLPNAYEMEIFGITEPVPLVVWETNVLDRHGLSAAMTTTVALPDRYRPYINFEI